MPDKRTTNEIIKTIELKAPQSRVWKAIADADQFGAWFRVKLEAPFVEGKTATGFVTLPGMERFKWNAFVTAIDPESYFAFEWIPYGIDPAVDYSKEKPTLCEFRLEKIDEKTTRLTVRESGFDHVPEFRRELAFQKNSGGWDMQMKNIEAYLA